jgi:hypothetical protein
MKKCLKSIKQSADYSAMESGNHSTNGASPKSLTSRRNFKFCFMLRSVIILTIAFFAFNIANAQEAEVKEEAAVTPQSVETLNLAGQLAKYGYANNSPSALIQAAELYLSVPKEELKAESVTPSKGTETAKTTGVSHDPKKLLADAKVMADGDQTLLALIDKAQESAKTRGAVGGAKYASSRVYAKDADEYVVRFRGGETAAVYVSGDGDTDLDVYIYNSSGSLVTSDTDYSDECVCIWRPASTASYKIRIKNRGNVYNDYTIVTN